MFYIQSNDNFMNYKRDTKGLTVISKLIIEIYNKIKKYKSTLININIINFK